MQIKEGRPSALPFKNQPKGELIIQKQDRSTGQPLAWRPVPGDYSRRLRGGPDGVIGDHADPERGVYYRFNGEIHITNLAPGAYVISRSGARPDMLWIRRPPMWLIGPEWRYPDGGHHQF